MVYAATMLKFYQLGPRVMVKGISRSGVPEEWGSSVRVSAAPCTPR